MGRTSTYNVPRSRSVKIGKLLLGAGNPLVIQSMANIATSDVKAGIEQFKRMAEAGAQLIRYTTPGLSDVKSLGIIIDAVKNKFPGIPIVADVHFNAKVANKAATICDKVRINPGNFSDKRNSNISYNNQLYLEGFEENREKLHTLIKICKSCNTALRIGVNHGSLSERIMSRFGDTPEGMVESAMEFLRICSEAEFHKVVVSLKSSNTILMVQAVRLIVKKMIDEDLYYPLHLGVTESGDGMEGRIRSVVGIAPLLLEGFGDTFRISLTEPPENEMPVARSIRRIFNKPDTLPYNPLEHLPWNPFHYSKPNVNEVLGIGGDKHPLVISSQNVKEEFEPDIRAVQRQGTWLLNFNNHIEKLESVEKSGLINNCFTIITQETNPVTMASIKIPRVLILDALQISISKLKEWFIAYYNSGGKNPVILRKEYNDNNEEDFSIRAAGEFGLFLIDHLLAGIWILNENMKPEYITKLSFFILQASRNRFTSTEYIACPSCGRTLFNIQKTLHDVRRKTSHLTGLKIAVMGCMVNGPGEMADADYGYIGSGRGLVTIYKGKDEIIKKVPENQAVDSLIKVIKQSGDWLDP